MCNHIIAILCSGTRGVYKIMKSYVLLHFNSVVQFGFMWYEICHGENNERWYLGGRIQCEWANYYCAAAL